jgi:DMSO/TMAO reductase YedYZ molybdopterin-dependent catalytic subunit
VSARLHVGGDVTTPQDLDFDALRALSEQLVEASPLLAGRAIAAVKLDTLLRLAGVRATARSIVAESADGTFMTTLPIAAAIRCVVVYRVGEAALPYQLGGPFRLVTNGQVHCGDVKELGRIYVSEHDYVDEADTERICIKRRTAA